MRELGPADHATLVYDDPGLVRPFCARFLTDGVNAGERVVAGSPGRTCERPYARCSRPMSS